MFQPKSCRIILLSIFCLSIGIVFAAQLPIVQSENDFLNNQTNNPVFPTLSPSPTPEIEHNLVAAFYDVENFPTAKLLLNNKGLQPIEVRPTLYNLDGNILEIAPVSVPANSHLFVNLSDWANIGGEGFQKGSLKLFHTGKDLIIGSQIYLSDEANSLSFEERLTELGKFDSRRLEAIWAMPSGQAQVSVILSNTSDAVLSVTAKLSREPRISGESQTFTFLPHQTRVLNLRTDFNNGEVFANSNLIGLTLEHTGEKSALKAHGQIRDSAVGYSNILNFSNPASGKSNELHGTGLHVGTMGNEQVVPVVAVKNVGTTTASVSAKFPYTRNDGTSGTVNLASINLRANEIRLLNTLPVVERSGQEQIKIAGIEITHNITPGSVIVNAQSVSLSRNQAYRVPMADPLAQTSSTGGYPWRIEETSRTVSYIKNMTDLEQEYVAFLMWENGGMYMIGLKKLAPNKTIEIDVKKLRDEQIPDEFGRLIPSNLANGQLQWTLRNKYQTGNKKNDEFALIGRSEQIDTANGISSSYACQNCCLQQGFGFVVPDGDEYEVGETVQFTAMEQGYNCYGTPYQFGVSANTWRSSNTNIATVNSSGLVTIQGAGNAEIEAEWITSNSNENNNCNPGPLLVKETDGVKDEKECEEPEPTNAASCTTCTLIYRQISPDADVFGKPKIKILRNGQDITITPQNQNVQNVVVGEKIELTTTVTGGTPSSKQWTIPGDKVKNYVASSTRATKTDLPSSDLNQSSIQFYWFTGENNRQVTHAITVNGRQYSVNAKFNVKQPIITSLNITHSVVTFATVFDEIRLRCEDNGNSCVSFTAQANNNGIDGTYQWVQTYSESKSIHLIGQIDNCNAGQTMIRIGEGVDVSYPYTSGLSMNDSPYIQLLTTVDRTIVNDSAKSWLMFKPNLSNSIWIPMKKVDWAWAADARRNPNNPSEWQLISYTDPNPTVTAISFPEWTRNVSSNTFQCQP